MHTVSLAIFWYIKIATTCSNKPDIVTDGEVCIRSCYNDREAFCSAHLMAKQAMDEVDLCSWLTGFGGYPEIKVADSCIQLLFKRQIL